LIGWYGIFLESVTQSYLNSNNTLCNCYAHYLPSSTFL